MTLIYFILILGLIVFIHELGHFLCAKKFGVYCYEFSIGFGPKLFSFNRKNDETTYSIRLFPLGGYVAMAGEEVDDDKTVPADKKMYNKSILQRFIIIVAGAFSNFVLGFIVLFLMALIYGATPTKPYINQILPDYPAAKTSLEKGDLIVELNDKKVRTWDDVLLTFELNKEKEHVKFKVKSKDNKYKTINIKAKKIVQKDKTVVYTYGIGMLNKKEKGFIPSIKYASSKFVSLYKTMFVVIKNLFTGGLSVSNLSGPVGIYSIVGASREAGFDNVLYLVAYLSINVGFINLLPFPAFDGGRLLFIIIEKIKGSKVKPETENMIHQIGLFILFSLMIYITVKDVLKIF